MEHYAIFINGTLKGFFTTKKCLGQGDPLSQFFFTMVVDILSKLISRVVNKKLIKGFVVGNGQITVSHLQFMDDTICFCEASQKYVTNLRLVLLCFERISDLHVNMKKSKVAGMLE